jgi:hypothetical protein
LRIYECQISVCGDLKHKMDYSIRKFVIDL